MPVPTDSGFWAHGRLSPHAATHFNVQNEEVAEGVTIWTGDGRHLRIVDVVPVEDEDSPFVGLLKVEAA